MSSKWFAARTLVVLLPLLAAAQQQQPQKWSGRVQSIVDGHGQAVTMVKSYVNRELRALGDVVLTDNADESEYLLSIVVVPVSGGYAISVFTAEHLSAAVVKTLLEQGDTKPDTIDLMNGFLKPMYHNTGHWLQTCKPLGLDKAIKKVVAEFDVATLQVNRDISRMLKNSLAAPKKKERPN